MTLQYYKKTHYGNGKFFKQSTNLQTKMQSINFNNEVKCRI